MNNFPVSSSILSPAGIGQFVCREYALAGKTSCKLLKAGINHTYRVDNNDESFVFRVYSYNWRMKEEITEELNLLNLLKQHNIAVSYPVTDKQGNYIQLIHAPEGERFAVLFSYAAGHKIQNYSKEIHFDIGRLMAELHMVTKQLKQKRPSYTPDTLLTNSLNEIRKFLPENTEEIQVLIQTKALLEREILQADTNFIRQGVVHLDIWFDNLAIADTNKITLFDFDFCGNGWLCLDMAYYIMQVRNTEKIETEREEKISCFLKGYETIQEISAEEKRLIPILSVCLYFFYLGIQCNRFENWSNVFLNEVYLKRYITVFIKSYYEKIRCNGFDKPLIES